MKDKVYVVTQEWGNTSLEDCNFEILGVFFDLREATLCMQKARNVELSESYSTPYEYLSHSMEVSVNEEDWRVEIAATNGKWDNFEIHEKEVEQRDFIAIQFEYAGEVFNERIYLDQIDLTHYDDIWDWWFGSHGSKQFPDLNFELTADKDKDGNPACSNMYINVYENEDAMVPLKRITDISWVHSWIERKEHHAKS